MGEVLRFPKSHDPRPALTLAFSDEDMDELFTATGMMPDERTSLLATLWINGQPHHLEAFQVDDEGRAIDESREQFIESFQDAAGAQNFRPIVAGGKKYMMFLTPFSD